MRLMGIGVATIIVALAPIAATATSQATFMFPLRPGAPMPRIDAAATTRSARAVLGSLVLAYDPAKWEVAAAGAGLTATCRRQDCRHVTVVGAMTIDPPESCSTAGPMGGTHARRRKTRSLPGLDLQLVSIDLGCRNLAAPRIAACVVHAGRVYRFDAAPGSCRSDPGFGREEAVTDLLDGLRPR